MFAFAVERQVGFVCVCVGGDGCVHVESVLTGGMMDELMTLYGFRYVGEEIHMVFVETI